jgi:hypothetical protein
MLSEVVALLLLLLLLLLQVINRVACKNKCVVGSGGKSVG